MLFKKKQVGSHQRQVAFFPTPRTNLETSVNLKRFFFQGEGVGVFEYNDPKWHWNHIFDPRSQKISGMQRVRGTLSTVEFLDRHHMCNDHLI